MNNMFFYSFYYFIKGCRLLSYPKNSFWIENNGQSAFVVLLHESDADFLFFNSLLMVIHIGGKQLCR